MFGFPRYLCVTDTGRGRSCVSCVLIGLRGGLVSGRPVIN